MKAHELRAAGVAEYFKLAVWNDRLCTWRDGSKQFPSEAEAMAAAKGRGRYRMSRVTESGRVDLEPFSI